MPASRPQTPKPPTARFRLLDAALRIIREKGFGATTVDELCAAAGVTKGAFFHHFVSKEALGVAAAEHWSETTSAMFAGAPYHDHADPLDRVLGYLEFRAWLIGGTTAQFTCLAGTMVQETFKTHPSIRDACYASIAGNAGTLEADLTEAIRRHDLRASLNAHGLAMHIQTVLQGAFVIAKAKDDPAFAVESIGHLKRYFEMLFGRETSGAYPNATAARNASMRVHLETLFPPGQLQGTR